jgi:hypothetical protein
MGIGRALFLPKRVLADAVVVEAEEIWVVATAPVRTRTATNARTTIFMVFS